jgi:predicted O-methyltransferase YrrM
LKERAKMGEVKRGTLLDVGCRDRKESNFTGINGRHFEGVDIVHNLETFPYPFGDESCLTIKAAHVVEHIKPWLVFDWFNEMWRLLVPKGQLAVSAPFANSQGFFNDPTHITYINEATFQHLDPNYSLYKQHEPLPWKIEYASWSYGGNIEAVLSKRTIEATESLTMSHKVVMLGALQKPKEVELFLDFVKGMLFKNILEIGTAKGGMFFALCQIASPTANIISLDMPGGAFGARGYVETEGDIERMNAFGKPKQKLHFIRQDSHKPVTLNRVNKVLGKEKLDLLFIDGDHTYEGVKKDWEMYGPLVRDEGLVVFHDIVDHGVKFPDCKVDRFWNELKAQNETWEFIDHSGDVWGGIGVLRKPAAKPERQRTIARQAGGAK